MTSSDSFAVATVSEFLRSELRHLNFEPMTQEEIQDEGGSHNELGLMFSVDADRLYDAFAEWCAENRIQDPLARDDFDDVMQDRLNYDYMNHAPGAPFSWLGLTRDQDDDENLKQPRPPVD